MPKDNLLAGSQRLVNENNETLPTLVHKQWHVGEECSPEKRLR
jgi:hypothetical protein